MILFTWTKIRVFQLVKEKCRLECHKDRLLVFTNYNPIYYSIKYVVSFGWGSFCVFCRTLVVLPSKTHCGRGWSDKSLHPQERTISEKLNELRGAVCALEKSLLFHPKINCDLCLQRLLAQFVSCCHDPQLSSSASRWGVFVDEVNNGLPRILGRTLYEYLYCCFLLHLWKQ